MAGWMRCDGCRGTYNEKKKKIKDLASLFCMNKAAGCAFFFFFLIQHFRMDNNNPTTTNGGLSKMLFFFFSFFTGIRNRPPFGLLMKAHYHPTIQDHPWHNNIE